MPGPARGRSAASGRGRGPGTVAAGPGRLGDFTDDHDVIMMIQA